MEEPESTVRQMSTGTIVTTLMFSGTTFTSLNRCKQGVGEIYKVQQAMGLLPELKEKPKKSDVEAQKLRIKGNQVYKAKDPMEALRLYTKAICCAESDGEEISMAYANRSAITFELEEFQNSIDDINRALSTGKYPVNLTQKLLERRGKCFLALRQYKKASDDLKQLIIIVLQTEIDDKKVDLLKRCCELLAECVGKDDIPEKQSARQPKLSHKPSSYIQSASEAVEIRFSPEMGRHIVATVDIAPGDILAIEKPFVSTIDHDWYDMYCDNCKRSCHSSIPCPSCNDVVFCSEICRETSWTTYHSIECQVLYHLDNLGWEGGHRLALRTLLKATKLGIELGTFMDDFLNETESSVSCKPEKVGFVNDMYLSDHYKATHHLITHVEDLNQTLLISIAVDACSLIHVIKEVTKFFETTDAFITSAGLFKPVSDLQLNQIVAANLLMRYMMVSASNSYDTHGISRSKLQGKLKVDKAIGCAIYPFLSLQNHSCDSDTQLCHYNGDTFIMFAIKPISKGQQIFGNYRFDYTKLEPLERQMRLRKLYYFTCKCIACLEDWPTVPGMPGGKPKFVSTKVNNAIEREVAESCRRVLNIFEEAEGGSMTEDQFRFLTQQLTLYHKYIKRPWKFYSLCQQEIIAYMCSYYNS